MSRTWLHILLMVVCCLQGQAQLRLNGKDIIHDNRAGQWLCTVPDSIFGTDYEAIVTLLPESGWTDVKIDGVSVAEGQSVWFTQLDGTTPHSLTAQVGDSIVNGMLLFSCLPLLEVSATLSESYQPATFRLHHPDSITPLALQGRIKWRGRTTMMAGRHKHNFHFKLEDEHGEKQNKKLLGLRDDNSWLLDAGQTDLSRIRNHVAHELWLDMAAKPYYSDLEPKARAACRGELIELFVNGQYEGIYTLMEAMDRKQLKLAKYETDSAGTNIIHGQLWKANNYTKGTTFTGYEDYDNTSTTWLGFETKYPELDEVSPTDYSVLYDAVNLAVTCYDRKWRRVAQDYYDLPVMRDYYIFLQVLLAIDNTNKNIYWAVYDKQVDRKVTLAVWDLDCTVGQDWTNTPFRPDNRVGPECKMSIANNVLGRLNLLITDFHDDIVSHYQELRKGVLHTDSITKRYLDHIDCLIHAGAAARESARWDGDDDLGGHSLDWEAEKAYIADWLQRRLRYLDINTFAPAAIDIIADDPADVPTGTYNLLGQRMADDRPLPPGFYVRNGKKMIKY